MDDARPTLQQRLDALTALDYELLERDEYARILAQADTLLAECRTLSDATLIAHAMIERGRALFFAGQREAAADSMRDAVRHASQANLKTVVIHACDELALVLYDLADYLRALDAWLKCLELASALQDMRWCTKAYIGVGKVYDALRDYDSASYFHQMALQLAEMRDDHRLRCQIHINLASVAYSQRNYDAALAALDAAAALLANGVDNPVWQAEVVSYYGLVHFERREYETAQRYLQEAQQLYRSHKNAWGQVQVLLSLGKTHRQLGRNEEALEYLLSASLLARQTQIASLRVPTEALLAQVYQDLGRHREALAHHRQMHALLAAQATHHTGGIRLSTQIARQLAALEQRLDMERLRLRLAAQAGTVSPTASATVQSSGSDVTASS
ncbi:tetratricopeptide repeat protein [Chitinolyticbacter meiyuanensis]|uniref:tetratricopeptide repeat protein n=1 Tax=Chitinolyticbacter meiyuanensis TaxID=682798 RepID=UPI0011E5E3DE|nr:tetratricopeptide repeat protein [Chitinolyticbacter meiyuanensis]